VPDHDPNWDYNTQAGLTLWDQFATCLLAVLKQASKKAINFEKLQEIIQDRTENPATFLDRLTRALQQYTNIDLESTDGRQLLMTYFFSQSYPDTRAKLKELDRGPLTPQTKVLATTFKVFHSQDEKAECQKYQMLAQAMRGQTLNLNREINTHQTGAHQAPVSNAERRDTGPDSALIPGCHLNLVLDVKLMGIGQLIAPAPGGGPDSCSSPDLIGLATDD
jgi:hypothetical protein